MYLQLAELAITEIITGQLQTPPSFLLNGLELVCGMDQDDVVGSTPSGWSSADTVWFDPQSRNLIVVAMGIPAVWPEPEEAAKLVSWQTAQVQEGILHLVQGETFEVEVAHVRWMDEEGRVLVGVQPRAFADVQERLRLRIAPDLELWFADGEYCGWSLLNPARYLIAESGDEPVLSSIEPDRRISSILYTFLQIVTKWNSALMDEYDPELKAQLLTLYERTRAIQGQEPQRHILLLAIVDILDRFYRVQLDTEI